MILGWLGACATIVGALACYLASPHQALLAGHVKRTRWWKRAGLALLGIALTLLLVVMGPATAIFAWTTGAMLVWSIVPVGARWWRFRKEPAR